MDSAYSYLDELATEHAAELEPQPEPEPLPAAQPATGLALEWLQLFPKLPISGMTGSIAANCTRMAAAPGPGPQCAVQSDATTASQ